MSDSLIRYWRQSFVLALLLCAMLVPGNAGAQGALPARNWHLLDDSLDRMPGVSAERAFRELLAGKSPRRSIIVAVIDGGIDTAHAAFAGILWTNSREIAGNGKDDDRNGYVDDIHGWNYLGAPDGRSYEKDLSEEDRVLAGCRRAVAGGGRDRRDGAERSLCNRLTLARSAKRDTLMQLSLWLSAVQDSLVRYTKLLRVATGRDTLTKALVTALVTTNAEVQTARKWWLDFGVYEVPEPLIARDRAIFNAELTAFEGVPDPRSLVGDNYEKYDERGYGNRDVKGPEPSHGTHVAALIAARPDSGMRGVARDSVRIMMLRTVPDGDERDKDVANAIRYAVDNGAQIINMSFGKHLSPGKEAVDAAVVYAEKHGVLMVHAAGNESQLIVPEQQPYPSPRLQDGSTVNLWLEVGASSWHPDSLLAAPFSNYGARRVDLFAPGDEMLSAAPGGGYERGSGTSAAAPVVTGVAAVLMSYYPELSAAEVKRILLASVHAYSGLMTIRPMAGPDSIIKAPFESFSRTGGIVNLHRAIELIERERAIKATRPH